VPRNYFDERIAKSYQAKWPELFDPAVVDPAVAFLADLAGGGGALELGIGTGRIAIPLSQRGVTVHGIDLSPDMVAQLRAKRGSHAVGVTIGDFATARVGGTFKLAYLVRNTIMNLTTQDVQVACFRNVAAHLEPDGCFVIEVVVPALRRLPPGETVRAFTVTPAHLGFEEYQAVAQSTLYGADGAGWSGASGDGSGLHKGKAVRSPAEARGAIQGACSTVNPVGRSRAGPSRRRPRRRQRSWQASAGSGSCGPAPALSGSTRCTGRWPACPRQAGQCGPMPRRAGTPAAQDAPPIPRTHS
jgi:SAM-dependent methyltransferase